MLIKSFSKVNLTLKVISKSQSRLHEIQSLYCWVNLFDKIEIKKIKNKDKIIFKGPFAKFIKKKK
jgi:4-diphosphocytidyl-2-C-methyl-D-erythritol kinase